MDRAEELRQKIKIAEKEYLVLNAYQAAVKVVNNGGYGAIGNVGFRYFDPSMSEGITVTGQYVIKKVGIELNKYLNRVFKTIDVDYVIGSDTDSVMISLEAFVDKIDPTGKANKSKVVDAVNNFCETNIEVFLEKQFADLAVRLNAKENTLDMKREAICDWGLFKAKKNYIMRVWDMEHIRYSEPKLKIAGIETQRSDKPGVCRDAMRDLLDDFFDGTEKTLQAKVNTFYESFKEQPFHKIAFPKGVNGIKKYLLPDGKIDDDKTVPINSRAAIVYNNLLEKHPELASSYERVKERDKIKYLYLRLPNPASSHVVGFKDSLPKEFGLDQYVDMETMFEKTFLSPVQSLCDLVGWQAVKVENLTDLFE